MNCLICIVIGIGIGLFLVWLGLMIIKWNQEKEGIDWDEDKK